LVKALINPIAQYDLTHATDLLGTLRTFVSLNHAHGATAGKLSLHTNTLRQRLKRIEQLTHVDLANSDERFGLELALKLYDLQQRRGTIVFSTD
jgi:DNA-binding PucR family transcriptional regulator